MLHKPKKIVFSTHVSDDWFESVGAKKLLTSAKHFHPEIPFVVFKSKDIQKKFEDPSINWDTLIAPLCTNLAEEYDLVVHFDADSCITDTLDEILVADYDVAGVRNNNDFGKAGALPYPLEPKGTDPYNYLNAGLVASTRLDFWLDWVELNKQKAHLLPMRENDTLNETFHSGKYQTKILDPKEGNVYYGTSTQYGVRSNWESWKFIKYDNGLYLNGKKVKVLHHAGGHKLPKLTLDMFSPKVQLYLRYIADPPILIDSKGEKITLKNEKFIKMLFNSEHLTTLMNGLNTENSLLARKLIGKNNQVIVNFGANVGLYCLFVASRTKKLYAVEPTKEYVNIMMDLAKSNNINIELTDGDVQADLAIVNMHEDVDLDKVLKQNIKSFFIHTQSLDTITKLKELGYNLEIEGEYVYFNT